MALHFVAVQRRLRIDDKASGKADFRHIRRELSRIQGALDRLP